MEAFYIEFDEQYIFFLKNNPTFRKTKSSYRPGLSLAKNIDPQMEAYFLKILLWYFFLVFAKYNFSLFVAKRPLEFKNYLKFTKETL